jgi:hypothetical protein
MHTSMIGPLQGWTLRNVITDHVGQHELLFVRHRKSRLQPRQIHGWARRRRTRTKVGPRQAHVAFHRIRRRAGSELLNGGAALMLATSTIAIGLSRSASNFDPAKTQVRR